MTRKAIINYTLTYCKEVELEIDDEITESYLEPILDDVCDKIIDDNYDVFANLPILESEEVELVDQSFTVSYITFL